MRDLISGEAELDSEEDEPSETPGATCLEPIKSDLKKVAVGYMNAVAKIFDIDTGKQLLVLKTELPGSFPSQVNKTLLTGLCLP